MRLKIRKGRWTFLLYILVASLFITSLDGQSAFKRIPALGIGALLGEFYDARNNTFLGVSILTDKADNYTTLVEIPSTNLDYLIADKPSSKLFLLDLSAEIQAQVLSGMVKIEGSGKLLLEETKSADDVQAIVSYKVRTKREILNILYSDLRPYIDMKKIESNALSATHIVAAIDYGGEINMQFTAKAKTEEKAQEVKGRFEIALQIPGLSAEGEAGIELSDRSSFKDIKFEFKAKADVEMDVVAPKTAEDFRDIFNSMPEKVRELNDRKGKAMTYTLFPVATLQKLFSLELNNHRIVRELDDAILVSYRDIMDEMAQVKLKVNDLRLFLNDHKNCTSPVELNRITKLYHDFKTSCNKFTFDLRTALYNSRVTGDPQNLQDLFLSYEASDWSANKVEHLIETGFQGAEQKIEIYKIFQNFGFDYFGPTDYKNFLLTNRQKILYIIFLYTTDGENWQRNWDLFHGTLNQTFSKLAIVDCSFKHDGCASSNNMTVTKQYLDGTLISENVYQHLSPTGTDTTDSQTFELRVSAVGRTHRLGDLYNANTHEFFEHDPLSLFNKIPFSSSKPFMNNESLTIVDNTMMAKLKRLRFEPPSLQLQILLDSTKWPKSGRMFQDMEGYDPKSVSKTIIHEFHTVLESLPEPDASLFESIDFKALVDSKATHYVQKIQYGGLTAISLTAQAETSNLEDKARLLQDLEQDITSLVENSPISDLYSSSDHGHFSVSLQGNYTIKIESDLVDHVADHLEDFLNEFSARRKHSHGGKGVPVLYILHPLRNLQKFFGAIAKRDFKPEQMNARDVEEMVHIFDVLYTTKEKVNSIVTELIENSINGNSIVDSTTENKLKEEIKKTVEWLTDYRISLENLLDGNQEKTSLLVLEEWRPIAKQCTEITRAFRPYQKKLKFLQWMNEKFPEIEYFGSNSNLVFGLSRPEIRDKFVYVLRYKMNFTRDRTESGPTSDDQWGDNFMLLTKFATGKEYNRAILLDCDHNDPKCENLETPSIQMYRNGDLIHENVFPMVISAKLSLQGNGSRLLKRQAYGRSVPLGSLYNARTESFTGNSLFRAGQEPNIYPEGVVSTQTASFQKRNHQQVEIGSSNITQRFAALSLDKDVQLTLLFDPDKSLEKSGKFLDPSLDFTKGLITTFISKVDSLNFTSNAMLQNFNPSQLNLAGSTNSDDPTAPTHFLSEIRLGANSIITVGKSNNKTADEEIKSEECFDHVKSLSKTPNLKVNNSIVDSSCNFEIFTDFSRAETAKSSREKLDIVLEELRQKTQNRQVLSDNDSPVLFILEPIERLFEPLGIVTPRVSYNQLSPKFDPTPFTVYFGQVAVTMQEANALHEKALYFSTCLPENVLKAAQQNARHLESKIKDFQKKMKVRLEQVKSGKKAERHLENELEDQVKNLNVRNPILESIPQKIEMFKFFNTSSNSVHYFGKLSTDSNFQDFLRDQSQKIVYVIVIKDPSDSTSWTSLTNLYTSRLKRTFSSLAVVDCDFSYSVCTTAVKNVMHQYWREKTVSSDVLKDLKPVVDQQPTIQVSAVGRNHKIGDLYNARTNKFTGSSLFKEKSSKPEFALNPMKLETGVLVEDRLDEKFNQLNIQPISLRYSILLTSPELSHRIGKTFQQKTRRDAKSISKMLVHIYNGKKESFQEPDENSFNFFSIEQLQKTEATHFVQEIVLGAQTIISLTTSVDSRANLDGLLENFRQHLFNNESAMPVKLPAGVSLAFASDLMDGLENPLLVSPTPQDLSRFFQEFSSIRKANGGRGEPVLYLMFPLENLFQHLGTLKNPHLEKNGRDNWQTQEKERSLELSQKFARVIDALNAADNYFAEMLRTIQEHQKYANSQTQQQTKGKIEKLRVLKKLFSVFDRNTGYLTSNTDLNSTYIAMKDATLKSGLFDPNFELLDDQSFPRLISKITFFEKMTSAPYNFTFIGRGQRVSYEMKNPSLNDLFVFVFFYKPSFVDSQVDLWDQNLDLLTGHLKDKPYNQIVIVDCDFDDPLCATISKPTIQLYRNGKLLRRRVLDDWKEAIEISNVAGRKEEIKRQALGRWVALGDLYNIHSEKFIGSSLFKTKEDGGSTFDLSSNFVKLTPTLRDPNVVFRQGTGIHLSHRFKFLHVDSNQQLSWVLRDQTIEPGERTGKFLDQTDDYTQIFIRSHQRGAARLNLLSSALPEFLAPENLMSDPGNSELDEDEKLKISPTHFVREIRLGSNTIVAVKNPDSQNQGTGNKNCSELLKSHIKNPGPTRAINFESLFDCDFNFFTDLGDPENDQLSSKDDFSQLISILARDAETPFENLNSPSVLSFVLEPIESLAKPLGIVVPPHKTYQELPNLVKVQLNSVTDSFSRLSKKLADLEGLAADMFDKECITPEAETAISEEIEKRKDDITDLKNWANDQLVAIKSGAESSEDFVQQIQRKIKKVEDESKNFDDQRQKLELFEYQASKTESDDEVAGRYFGRNSDNFDDLISSGDDRPIYILYFRNISNPDTNVLWLQTSRVFFKFLDVPENNCFIIDCDFDSNFDRCEQNSKPIVIHHIEGTEVKSTDFLPEFIENYVQPPIPENPMYSMVSELAAKSVNFNYSLHHLELLVGRAVEKMTQKVDKTEMKNITNDFNAKNEELDKTLLRLKKSIADLTQDRMKIKGLQQTLKSSFVEVANNTQRVETVVRKLNSSIGVIQTDQTKLNSTQVELKKAADAGKNIKGVLMWRIPNVRQLLRKPRNREILHSDPFYTDPYGYKLEARMKLNGDQRSFVSLYVRILPGEFDSILKWPFSKTIRVTLYDQTDEENAQNLSTAVNCTGPEYTRPTAAGRALLNLPGFVSHSTLLDHQFIVDDTILIRVEVSELAE